MTLKCGSRYLKLVEKTHKVRNMADWYKLDSIVSLGIFITRDKNTIYYNV